MKGIHFFCKTASYSEGVGRSLHASFKVAQREFSPFGEIHLTTDSSIASAAIISDKENPDETHEDFPMIPRLVFSLGEPTHINHPLNHKITWGNIVSNIVAIALAIRNERIRGTRKKNTPT